MLVQLMPDHPGTHATPNGDDDDDDEKINAFNTPLLAPAAAPGHRKAQHSKAQMRRQYEGEDSWVDLGGVECSSNFNIVNAVLADASKHCPRRPAPVCASVPS